MATHVLLVDDDPVLLEVLETVLDLEGFVVATATSGEAAMRAVADEPPDVVVCDVAMPGIDGLEVCRRLKSAPGTRHVTVVLLTVRGSAQDRAAGLAAGCDTYLTKPFSPTQLVEVLHAVPSSTPRSG